MAVVHHVVDDPLQVGVVPRHDADQQVTGPGDRVCLQHLGDGGQVLDDGGVPLPWRISSVQKAETG